MTRPRRPAAALATLGAVVLAASLVAGGASATSPDRNGRIAFHIDSDDGRAQLWTVRPNGHDLRQITEVPGRATSPDWSPDGRRLTFTLDDCTIGVVDAYGSNLEIVAADTDICQGD